MWTIVTKKRQSNFNYFVLAYKTTTILLDGKRVKLLLWDTSGQGRFCTILRSYSRGAQGILLVYDITNKWSFDSIDRWLEEVEKVSNTISALYNKRYTVTNLSKSHINVKVLFNNSCKYVTKLQLSRL